jgi:hypothetical protein
MSAPPEKEQVLALSKPAPAKITEESPTNPYLPYSKADVNGNLPLLQHRASKLAAFRKEVDTLSDILGKYTKHDSSGNWLKLRPGVLTDKTKLWCQPKKGLLDIAVIIDALWDEYQRRNKEGLSHAS